MGRGCFTFFPSRATNRDLRHYESNAMHPGAYVTWMSHQRQFGPDSGIAALKLTSTDHVLDLGCGPGADARERSENGDFDAGRGYRGSFGGR